MRAVFPLVALAVSTPVLGQDPCYETELQATIGAGSWYGRTCMHRDGSDMLDFDVTFRSIGGDKYYVEVDVGNGSASDEFGTGDSALWRAVGKSSVFWDSSEHTLRDSDLSAPLGASHIIEQQTATRLRWHCVEPGSGKQCQIEVLSMRGGSASPSREALAALDGQFEEPRVQAGAQATPWVAGAAGAGSLGHPRTARRAGVAMALEGGGFKALASDIGITAGLLAVLGKDRGKRAATLSDSGLFGRIDTISTVSGGAWFMAELAYSSNTVSLVEAMAASPETAGYQFYKHWMSKYIVGVGRSRGSAVNTFADLLNSIGFRGWAQFIQEAGFAWTRGQTWSSFVHTLLNSTSGIDARLLLGAPVTAWAEGKSWLVCHSAVTPSGRRKATIWERLLGVEQLSYVTEHPASPTPPTYVPAAFSVTLGAGVGTAAPFPYMPGGEALASHALKYHGRSFGGLLRHTASSPAFGDFPGVTEDAGRLRVLDVVSASSAVLGGVCLSPFMNALNSVIGATSTPFTPWVSSARGGAAFADARQMVQGDLGRARWISRGLLRATAARQVRGVIDGAYTDNTGVSHAVAAGAREVVAFLTRGDALSRDFLGPSLLSLFQGAPDAINDYGVPVLKLPIFAEGVGDVRKQLDGFQQLTLPESNRYLSRFAVGTISATTAESRWFGIAAGHNVSLRVVTVSSKLNAGFGHELESYDDLVQEIVDCLTLAANANAVRGTLLKWLVPQSRRLIAV